MRKALIISGAAVVCLAGAGAWRLLSPRAGVEPGDMTAPAAALLASSQSATFVLFDSGAAEILSIPKPRSAFARVKERLTALDPGGGESSRTEPVFMTEMKKFRPLVSLVFDAGASRGRETAVGEIKGSLVKANASGAEVSIIAHRHAVIAVVLALKQVDFAVPRVVALGMNRVEFKRLGKIHFPGRSLPNNVKEWANLSLVHSMPPSIPIEYYFNGQEERIFAGEQVFPFLDMAAFRGTGSHYQSAAEKDLAQAVAILTRAGGSMRETFSEGLRAGAEHEKRKQSLEELQARALIAGSAPNKEEDDDSLSLLMKAQGGSEGSPEKAPVSAPKAPAPDKRFEGLPFVFAIPEGWKAEAPILPGPSGKIGNRRWELNIHDRMDFRTAVRRRESDPPWATLRTVYYESPGRPGEQFSGNTHSARAGECFDLGGAWRFCGELIAAMDIAGGRGYLLRQEHPSRESPFAKKIENLLLIAEMPGDKGLHTILLITPAVHESRYMPLFEAALKTYNMRPR